MKKIIFSVVLVSVLMNCSEKTNLSKIKAARIYVDLQILNEEFSQNKDSLTIHKANVFKKYSTNEEEYFKTISEMEYDEDKWNDFFDLSLQYLDSIKTAGEKQNP